jgi:hypothetical protein
MTQEGDLVLQTRWPAGSVHTTYTGGTLAAARRRQNKRCSDVRAERVLTAVNYIQKPIISIFVLLVNLGLISRFLEQTQTILNNLKRNPDAPVITTLLPGG